MSRKSLLHRYFMHGGPFADVNATTEATHLVQDADDGLLQRSEIQLNERGAEHLLPLIDGSLPL